MTKYSNKEIYEWETETIKYFHEVYAEIICPHCGGETSISFDEDYMQPTIDRIHECFKCDRPIKVTGKKELLAIVEFNFEAIENNG